MRGVLRGDEGLRRGVQGRRGGVVFVNLTATYASVAKDLGVNRETLRLWVKPAGPGRPVTRSLHVPQGP